MLNQYSDCMNHTELIEGDSMKIIKTLNIKFDMIMLDPPFTEWHASEIRYDANIFSYDVYRSLKQNGVVWLWGYTPQLLEDWKYWGRFFKCVFDMVRIKPEVQPPPVGTWCPNRAHETILCLIRKDDKITETKLNFRRKLKPRTIKSKTGKMRDDGREKTFKEYEDRAYIISYQSYPSIGSSSKEYYGHPTQKPERLIQLLIESSTKEGDWILDPFAGSGTTLVVSRRTNRNCIGIEINPEYCKIIKKRLEMDQQVRRIEEWLERYI